MNTAPIQDFQTPSDQKFFKKKPAIIIIFIPLSMIFLFSFSVFYHGTPEFRVDKTQNGLKVGKIHQPVNPVQLNDVIVSINGLDYHQILSLVVSSGLPLDPQKNIVLKRGSRYIEFKPELNPLTLSQFFFAAWPHLLLIISLIVLGLMSYIRTPSHQPAFLFLLATSFFATLFSATFPSYFGILDPYTISLSFFVLALCNWVAFGACLHFVFSFPTDRNIIKNKPWLIAVFYLSAPLISITSAWILADTAGDFWGWLQRLRNVGLPFMAVIAFTKHFMDYRRVTSSLEKNQIKLIISAYWLSFGPYLFFYAIPNMLFNTPFIPFRGVVLSSIILPGAYFIALIRYRMLDVDKMISRTLSYFLLIGLLLVSYAYLTIFLQRTFMERTIFTEDVFLVYIILVAVLFEPVNRLISVTLDKIFLPADLYRYNMMPAISRNIGTSIHLDDLTRMLTQTIPTEFHIKKLMLLIFDDPKPLLFPKQKDFYPDNWNLNYLKSRLAAKTDYLFCNPSTRETSVKKDLTRLHSDGVELIFALRGRTGLSGLLLLGKREDGRPYKRKDVQFLTTISNQTGLALENIRHYESLIQSKKQIEKMFSKVVQAEKMAALGEMATVLAHELKNPLGIIRSSAQYLTKASKERKTRQELLAYIIGEVDGLEAVINNMMGLARYKTPHLAAIDLYAEMSSMIDLWERSGNHNQAVSIQLAPLKKSVPVFADFKQLQQVFLNCITNAESAMSGGGSIHIAITSAPDDAVDIHIRDTGPGISTENLKHVFKKFFTTKEKGMGIGLSVCKQIISAHNGYISLENMTHGGLSVLIHLPCKPLSIHSFNNNKPDIKELTIA